MLLGKASVLAELMGGNAGMSEIDIHICGPTANKSERHPGDAGVRADS
jgi:hypothetical protein